ncbi:MAG: hypothetical protein NE328_14510 [Lentisphaeraceae bacterium]|nr:hypothetical protein [Lentisphaeraceae bacterium]
MVYYGSLEKAQNLINKTEDAINDLITSDLQSHNCQSIDLDNWMDLFSKNEKMQEKYLTLCNLEMLLIDAQLFVEHQKE